MMLKQRAVVVGAFFAVCVLLIGCGGGGGTVTPPQDLKVTVSFPTSMQGGQQVTWSVSWDGGTGPFDVQLTLAGGATENLVTAQTAASPYEHLFTMLQPTAIGSAGTHQYSVLVVDTQGHAGDASGMYMVEPGPNQSPTLVSADYDSETYALTLKTNDSDGDSVTIEINTPADMLAEPQVVTADAQGNAVSYLSGYGMVTGGEVSLTVSDSQTGGSRTYNVTISGMTFETDTLYAIPLKTRAEVDEEVNLVVITGPIALNKPFQFMNGVGLVMPDGGTTSSLHFNHGAPGGKAGDVDGFWEAVDPGGGFLLPPDIFWPAPTDIGDGLERWDFFAIPIGGRDIAGEGGALFNCRYAFTYAGQYELSFQEATGVVKRTYYSDSEINEYFWGDISNDHDGMPHTIIVE